MSVTERGVLFVAFSLSLLCFGSLARADMATAEALFREARELFDQGEIAKACAKFAESQRLDPSSGTLLNLARCHREQGKTATAWAEYVAAQTAAETQGREDLALEAARQAEALRPTLSTMTLRMESPPQGLVVKRNGEAVELAALGSSLPVDPGRYTIEAVAPGFDVFTTEVTVEGGADQETVTIPPLTPLPEVPDEADPGAPTEPPAVPARGEDDGSPMTAYLIGGAGVVITGVGLTFGGLAKATYDDAVSQCPARTNCSTEAIALRDDADTFANVANVAVPVGLAAIGVGVVLLFLDGSPNSAEVDGVSFSPILSPQVNGGVITGAF